MTEIDATCQPNIQKEDERSETPIHGESGLDLKRFLIPVMLSARIIFGTSVVMAFLAIFVNIRKPARYRAEIAFSTSGPNRVGAIAGSFPAALLNATSMGGLQATPALLERLARSYNVRVHVARQLVPGRGETTIADLLLKRNTSGDSDQEVGEAVGRVLRSDSERETGLVTLAASHSDSAVARQIINGTVQEVTRLFQAAVKAQAASAVSSLDARLAAARTRLDEAEERTRTFEERNRVVISSSKSSVTQGRLMRELDVARTLYNQVTSEREAAIGRQLEDAQVVVVVDPVPRTLVQHERNTVYWGLATFLGTMVLLSFLFIAKDMTRRPDEIEVSQAARFEIALGHLPFVRTFRK